MYIRRNRVKEKLQNGELVLGMETWIRDPRLVELAGQAGFDFAHIEFEHVARNWESVENMVRAAELAGLTPLFRTEQCIDGSPPLNQIIKALKLGVKILLVPQVDTAEQARKVVAATKFPPAGQRGISTTDRSATALFPTPEVALDVRRYADESNQETMVWLLIESPEGVANIDSILAVEGVDVVGFGHQDYSLSAGETNDGSSRVHEARETVYQAVKKAGKTMLWVTPDPEEVGRQAARGVNLFLTGTDLNLMDTEMRKLATKARGCQEVNDDREITQRDDNDTEHVEIRPEPHVGAPVAVEGIPAGGEGCRGRCSGDP
ncbi:MULTISPECIES: HpcH/HpaI aldolase family protein [unclassified Shinella]|uniref:HpcH/HpaI aldolase family protein n=1 Tax=unclassified Shinella TaxID=2643062 RepID=UPI00225D6672|nr:aldolase/citrate lyase family protein [Shinella sp. YE25]MDC7260125.1 hypothetical protein [Shinella sp. YE25]CAI0341134.1 2,4-dihydroxyhept-2-ene-1,7-dioic acid aldolase [Rhizobiaceae bacterium]CAK7262169.1 4-hydroxy-2-oxoheptanedioate aldolase [Shinella sp. WSC3-e]